MPEVVLTPEQWAAVASADRVDVKDPSGRLVGWLSPADAALVALVREQRSVPRRCYTSEQVRRQMAVLETERLKHGGRLPPERMAELVAEFDATDPPAGSIAPARPPR